ncbi:MAG: hypothetical protein ABI140_11950 [Jatrophihabitantaceae bacterium]
MIGKLASSTSASRRYRAGRLAVLALAASALVVPAVTANAATSAAANRAPIGHFDSAVVHGSTVTVSGWTVDPDYPHNSIVARAVFTPNLLGASTKYATNISHDPRADVAAAHPEFGPNHGFSFNIETAMAGTSRLCLYGVDFKAGPDGSLGCLSVTVLKNHAPVGHLDSVIAKGNDHIEIRGWTADADTPSTAVSINLLLGGMLSSQYYKSVPGKAALSRPDVAAAYPALGAKHGFDVTVAARAGRSPVCAIAFDTDPNYQASTSLGCITVTVS